MSASLYDGLLFLINIFFDLYLLVLMIRVLLAWANANYFDPITQFVVKLTDFIVKPVRRIIPNVRGIEVSTLVIILVLEIVKFLCISLLSTGMPSIIGLVLLSIADMFKLLIQCFFYGILLQAILSWVQPHSPVNFLLYQVTSPVMRPFQRVIPPIGGIDISPIAALIFLQFIIIVLINPLMAMAIGIAFG
ncbi:MAG: hypothetical protein ACD_46C00619G0008 [uncultured bacterium]|nr:MAG: hypothetical protein ACD_46C00619G0008 [uncultured bacterium]